MDGFYLPSLKEFEKYALEGNLVPVMREIILDCETPVSAFFKLCAGEKNAFLLESVEYGEKIGRYSILGFDPDCIYEKYTGKIHVKQKGCRKRIIENEDLLGLLQSEMQRFKLVRVPNVPLVGGGFVGFFSYENVTSFEDVILKKRKSLGFPDAVFFLCKKLLVFDHVDKKVKIIVYADIAIGKRQAYREAIRIIEVIEKRLRKPLRKQKKGLLLTSQKNLKSNMTQVKYEEGVNSIKKYIKSGDVIQVVFSQRFSLGEVEDDFSLYRALRTVNPSPYMFYFKNNDVRLIGSSPEVLVKNTGGVAEVRPIAGTRKRGTDETEDAALAKELKEDSKEGAEHLMLVDLGRNDLGRVCEFGSVKVKDYARIEKYSHVMHLVSEVHGKLNKNADSFDLLKVTFPAGTLSGAPKIRAMEIINELEPDERGPYGGCLGYFAFSGDCDMCITIRTIMIKDQKAYLQAGAGIVHDSVPHKEYEETVNKASALLRAVKVAQEELE